MSATNASPSDIDRMEHIAEAMKVSVGGLRFMLETKERTGSGDISALENVSRATIESMQERVTSLASSFRKHDEDMKGREEKLQSEEAAAIQREEALKHGEGLLSKGEAELKQQQEHCAAKESEATNVEAEAQGAVQKSEAQKALNQQAREQLIKDQAIFETINDRLVQDQAALVLEKQKGQQEIVRLTGELGGEQAAAKLLRSQVDTERTQLKFEVNHLANMEKTFAVKEADLRRDRADATKKADRRESVLNNRESALDTRESAIAARESALAALIAKHTETSRVRMAEADELAVEFTAGRKKFEDLMEVVEQEKKLLQECLKVKEAAEELRHKCKEERAKAGQLFKFLKSERDMNVYLQGRCEEMLDQTKEMLDQTKKTLGDTAGLILDWVTERRTVDREHKSVSQAQAELSVEIRKPFEKIAEAIEEMARQLQEHDKVTSEMTGKFDVTDLTRTVANTDSVVAGAAEKTNRAIRDFTRKLEQDSSARTASDNTLTHALAEHTRAVDGVFEKVETFSEQIEKLEDSTQATTESHNQLTSKVKDMVKELEKLTITAGTPALAPSALFSGGLRTARPLSLRRKFSDRHGPQDSDDEATRRASPSAPRSRAGSIVAPRQSPLQPPVQPEEQSSEPDEEEANERQREAEVLSQLNEVSRNLISQMITPADWTTDDRRRMQACFLKLQDNPEPIKQPRFGLDWCATNAATGMYTTCWYQRVLKRKARWNGPDLFTHYCPGCQRSDGTIDVCIDVKWADDDQAALPFDPTSTQKRWIIQKRPKA